MKDSTFVMLLLLVVLFFAGQEIEKSFDKLKVRIEKIEHVLNIKVKE